MQQVFRAIGRLSRSSVTVLITGRVRAPARSWWRARCTSTARAPAKPFVALNTVGDPGGAARVGAVRSREGRLHRRRQRSAAGASSRPTAARCSSTRSATCRLPLQTRLLRVLAEGRVLPRRRPDADPRRRARDRRDPPESRGRASRAASSARTCYHRLNVIRIELPPLRARARGHPGPAAPLPGGRGRTSSASSPRRWRPRRSRAWPRYDWPGNVRELVNLCRRLTVLAPGSEVHLADLPPELAMRPRRAMPRRLGRGALRAGRSGSAHAAAAAAAR